MVENIDTMRKNEYNILCKSVHIALYYQFFNER